MKVTLEIFKALQSAVYDGVIVDELIPIYHEFASFCETEFNSPDYAKLVEGLIHIEVE